MIWNACILAIRLLALAALTLQVFGAVGYQPEADVSRAIVEANI